MLGYVDPQISLTFIENGHVTRKNPDQPKRLVNVIKCTNPRCITSMEEGCDHIFALTPSGRYRCVYCEQEFKVRPGSTAFPCSNPHKFQTRHDGTDFAVPLPGLFFLAVLLVPSCRVPMLVVRCAQRTLVDGRVFYELGNF